MKKGSRKSGVGMAFDAEGAVRVLRLSGRLTLGQLGDLPKQLAALPRPIHQIDLSGVNHIDTVGSWIVHGLIKQDGAIVIGATPEATRLIAAVTQADHPIQIRPHVPSPFLHILEEIGEGIAEAFRTMVGLLGFTGGAILAVGRIMRQPSRLRVNAVVQQFRLVGINALGLIAMMSLMIGVVIAQQGAVQLQQFGMDVFTVNLVARSSVRELGILLTSIMIAGRSGSAFAAQIGTMKLTEEIDAMRIIGVSPFEALVVPRMFATVIMLTFLGFFSGIMALVGGMLFCWIGLEIPPATFVQRVRDVLPMTDLLICLIKAPVYGMLIAVSGCYQGMQVNANAEEVGLRTTAAVVQSIFLVMAFDAFFAIFFTSIGWK
jgi:phospholipid/cholesterol/gamma-HCH transport system permease protein